MHTLETQNSSPTGFRDEWQFVTGFGDDLKNVDRHAMSLPVMPHYTLSPTFFIKIKLNKLITKLHRPSRHGTAHHSVSQLQSHNIKKCRRLFYLSAHLIHSLEMNGGFNSEVAK